MKLKFTKWADTFFRQGVRGDLEINLIGGNEILQGETEKESEQNIMTTFFYCIYADVLDEMFPLVKKKKRNEARRKIWKLEEDFKKQLKIKRVNY